ncbi:phosphate ABC transporter ATP-binding protein [Priestia endophytica]|uniref:ABC transporter ATP-binding protein n=1 Tax=Priestia endophytica TaxID=135735 RepID=UPI00227FD6F4|nr:ATP-binding cassette domain-containing protein [Priestia endophytica]MCY8234875.1 ATP-binding cassette domain-containing protein [Priestia endophytica]
MIQSPVIEFKSVSKHFIQNGETKPVLHGISGAIQRNSVVVFVGPSGSGKSTLLSLCNLLISPNEGEIVVEGKEVREWNISKLRQHVGIAFQNAPVLDGTVEDNLLLTYKLHKKQTYSIEQLIAFTGLPKTLLQQEARSLSGGQKQKLSLARTLANNSSVLLLDEITAALDPLSTHEVEDLVLRLNKEENKTIVWVTHDLEQARRVGDLVWLIEDGRVVERASVQDFFTAPTHERTKQFLMGEAAWTL